MGLSPRDHCLLPGVQCLENRCLKYVVWLSCGFRWEPVPVIPSWLEAESSVCSFSPWRDFPRFKWWREASAQPVLTPGAPDRQESLARLWLLGKDLCGGSRRVPPAGSSALRPSVWAGVWVSLRAPHTLSAACPSAECTAERGSRVRAENPRALGLASRGTRSRCCHGE